VIVRPSRSASPGLIHDLKYFGRLVAKPSLENSRVIAVISGAKLRH
jgi:hypothetical protein